MSRQASRPGGWRVFAKLTSPIGVAAIAILFGVATIPTSAASADTPSPTPPAIAPTLTVCRDTRGAEGAVVWLIARSTSQDGEPVVSEDVHFKVKRQGRWEDLGVSKTSKRGAAGVKFRIPLRSTAPSSGDLTIPFTAELLPRQPLRSSKGSGLISVVSPVRPLTPEKP